MTLTVHTFHRSGAFALLDDGSQIPITNWIGADGNDCGGFDHPVSFVAGPDVNGDWHSVDIDEFDPVTVH
ncbi:hypothetical protein [Sulfitobacter pacificus]|uniref:hypothetical protein n=1 Tax=Sulfitobacter pacificus TaxID=1499314 RepID=UPI00310BDEF3